ncbi:MAG TPA: hypothetical protein GX497_13755 [Bacillus bacterium]|nr:hypothetical protein [Bacillus sp. (in: firmicutes)]
MLSFNTSGFNQGFQSNALIGNINVVGLSEAILIGNAVFSCDILAESKGLVNFTPTLKIDVHALAEAKATQFNKVTLIRIGKCLAEGKGKIEISDAFVGIVRELFYKGKLNPGDQLVIDSDKMTVVKNGMNDLRNFEGDFFELNGGKNIVTIDDGGSKNDIHIRISYRNRFA